MSFFRFPPVKSVGAAVLGRVPFRSQQERDTADDAYTDAPPMDPASPTRPSADARASIDKDVREKDGKDGKVVTVSVDEVSSTASSSTAGSPTLAATHSRKTSTSSVGSVLLRDRANSLGFSPIRHIASTYRVRAQRPRKYEYADADDVEAAAGRSSDEQTMLDDAGEDTYLIDEDTLVSQGHVPPHDHDLGHGHGHARGTCVHIRRRWIVCGVVCSVLVLGVLLVLNILVFVSQSMQAAEADPDGIFSGWGHPGTGTEGLDWYPGDFLRDVVPVACHSHNDYWRKVPLFSALHAGCVGTEADVWLVDDELYVGHGRSELSSNRTFRSLYVDPLVRILTHQNPTNEFYNASSAAAPRGVFDMAPNQTLALLVDVKTAGDATFRKVLEQVEPLRARGWLSTYEDGQVKYGPVTLVASGNTPFDLVVENGTYRFAFFDAPLAGLENSVYDLTNSYYASVAIDRGLGTVWFGAFRDAQRQRLQYQLHQAHARGLKARYWSLPSWPVGLRNSVWATLVEAGVDLLNVDDIKAATRKDWTR